VAAADYVERSGIRGNAFNTYSAGAYLVYRFHPAVRVGMDSRNDVYREDLWEEYTRALVSPGDLARILERLDASFMFIEWPQQGVVATAAAIRDLSPAWRPVYFDDVAVVYLGNGGPYAAVLGRDGYSVLDPALFRPGSWSEAEAGTALAEADRAIAVSGGAWIARVMRFEALRVLGRRAEAGVEEARLVAEDPPLYHIQILLGLAHLARGERAEAAARLRRALELNPASQAARQALEQALSGG
jgi:tetratricopeptide (TPR) repeat protein